MVQTRYQTVATAAVFLVTIISSTAEIEEEASKVVTIYNIPGLELDTTATTIQQRLNNSEAVIESFSSVSLLEQSYTESLNDSDDIYTELDSDFLIRFDDIRQRAKTYPAYRRKQIHYPRCCFVDDGESCNGQMCLLSFVAGAESDNATSDSYPTQICAILYQFLSCGTAEDEDVKQECADYCYCFNTDPLVEVVSYGATAANFGCVFLTLCVYACVPRLRNLYGKCFMSYLVSVIVAEIFATIRSNSVCSSTSVVVEFLLSFFTLARYGWVNMLCVEVFCACRPFYSVRHNCHQMRKRGRRKFFYYSLAVWGGAAAVFSLIKIIPGFESTIVHLVVIFLLLFSSCVPLILTLTRVWGAKKHFDNKLAGVYRRKLCWFYMTAKLLCLSGIGKICSVIIYLTIRGTPYYQWLTILLKIEGPLLFILFVCNYRVRGRVRERLSEFEWRSCKTSNDGANTVRNVAENSPILLERSTVAVIL